ncbi:MAG TPA: hypothetical protein VEY09_05475 [Pyrinomonadaceae bacterium]|nr:hypothetical protein [Pyrinomonadaceae bacterium]
MRSLAFAALLATFTLPALAQDAAAGTAASAQDDEAKAALYGEFVKLIGVSDAESQRRAHEKGKEYLSRFGTPATDADKQVVDYIRNWVNKYEAAVLEYDFGQAVTNNPARAFELGRQILTNSPDRMDVRLWLAHAGVVNNQKGNKSLNGEALSHARAALQMVEQGKAPQKWVVWPSRDEAVVGLNLYVATLLNESSPQEAITTLVNAAKANGPAKSDARVYTLLGTYYYKSEFGRLAGEYKQQCEGKDASPECDALFARVQNALDHVIDAYARAVAYSKDAKLKAAAQKDLTAVYKIRFQSVTNPEPNIQTLVAGITALPIPQPGEAVTLPGAPADAPANSSASTTVPVSATIGESANAATAVTTTPPAANGTAAKPAVKPAAKPAAKPATKAPAKKARGRA